MLTEIILSFSQIPVSAYIVVASIFCACQYAIRQRPKSPRLIPDIPFAGLEEGQRSLKEAKQRFVTHGAEMLQDGYRMVGLVLELCDR